MMNPLLDRKGCVNNIGLELRKADGEERREVRAEKKGSAMTPLSLHHHGHPAACSGDGEADRRGEAGCGGGAGFLPCRPWRRCGGRES